MLTMKMINVSVILVSSLLIIVVLLAKKEHFLIMIRKYAKVFVDKIKFIRRRNVYARKVLT